MALLVDRVLEKKALKLITSGHPRSAWLLGKLNAESFASKPAKEAFNRVSVVAKKTSEIITWDELLHDPGLTEATRKALAQHKKKPQPDKEYAQALFQSMEKFRKIRVVYNALEDANREVLKESFDAEAVADSMADVAMKVRSRTDTIKTFHIGEGNNSAGLVKKLLDGKALPVIRTGFKTFDDMNRGFFMGSLVLLGANTGGGKTAMALQLAENFANDGAKVNITSLEMTEDEVMVRNLSRYSGVSMSRLIDPENMSPSEKKRVKQAYAERVKKLKARGASETIHVPTEDISIEELLFSLKPAGYDVYIIDYITLLKGTDGDDQWRKLGQIARFAKIFAKNNNCLVVLLVQVTAEGLVRYSKTIVEHANNAWFWVRDQKAKETNIVTVQQPKARNQRDIPFDLLMELDKMRVTDVQPNHYTNMQSSGPGIGHNSSKFTNNKPNGHNGGNGQANGHSNRKGKPNGKQPPFRKKVIDDEDSYFEKPDGAG